MPTDTFYFPNEAVRRLKLVLDEVRDEYLANPRSQFAAYFQESKLSPFELKDRAKRHYASVEGGFGAVDLNSNSGKPRNSYSFSMDHGPNVISQADVSDFKLSFRFPGDLSRDKIVDGIKEHFDVQLETGDFEESEPVITDNAVIRWMSLPLEKFLPVLEREMPAAAEPLPPTEQAQTGVANAAVTRHKIRRSTRN